MSHGRGQDGRSVLGVLAVQVERDPKTGTTCVRSVAPVSAAAGVSTATTVYDDGRKCVRAVGGSGGRPSSSELDQILSAAAGVGMKALLDDVPGTEDGDAGGRPQGNVVSFSTQHATGKEDRSQDGGMTAVRDIAGPVEDVEDLSLDAGPVTLVFLGYADGDGEDAGDASEGMLTAERVIITDEGEEHVLGPEDGRKESRVFQDVPLDGNGAGVKVPGEDGSPGPHRSSPPAKSDGDGANKRKTCRCCSVM
ncbi:paralemmin-2 [Etheostoma spectabile]|uniref:paralemmin-2 n=1 Tax=Etheostoma spectabile TaxID=54343 RepID=UPI0013AF353E|nr:paralemmin-2-like [Etheostoma spectabile]